MAEAGSVVAGQLEGMELVIVEGAQIDAVALAATLGQTEDADEEVEAVLEFIGVEFDMAEMCHVIAGVGHRIVLRRPVPVTPIISWNAPTSAPFACRRRDPGAERPSG
jgi:hypothetical protein